MNSLSHLSVFLTFWALYNKWSHRLIILILPPTRGHDLSSNWLSPPQTCTPQDKSLDKVQSLAVIVHPDRKVLYTRKMWSCIYWQLKLKLNWLLFRLFLNISSPVFYTKIKFQNLEPTWNSRNAKQSTLDWTVLNYEEKQCYTPASYLL